MKSLFFTQHARDAVDERGIDPAWIERAVRAPDWVVPDARRPGVELRFCIIPEYGNRVLRAACYETSLEIRILTVFFDRDAKRP
ncbi:MAG TPA: DUF4258 domain-containing protein [Rhizobiaceae bacterium]